MKNKLKIIILIISVLFLLIGVLFTVLSFVNGFSYKKLCLGVAFILCGIVAYLSGNDFIKRY